MPAYPGPTANLKARHRRSGRAGTVWDSGKMLGEVVSVEWEVEIEQVAIQIPGKWQDEFKPGGEARRGTFRFQDIDDRWRRMVWGFLQARKNGDRAAAAQFPTFDIITQIDDVGSPGITRWAIRGCQLFSYSGGFSQDDDQLIRDVPFTFEEDDPIDSFVYTDSGIATFQG
jgi:hypothetical protein